MSCLIEYTCKFQVGNDTKLPGPFSSNPAFAFVFPPSCQASCFFPCPIGRRVDDCEGGLGPISDVVCKLADVRLVSCKPVGSVFGRRGYRIPDDSLLKVFHVAKLPLMKNLVGVCSLLAQQQRSQQIQRGGGSPALRALPNITLQPCTTMAPRSPTLAPTAGAAAPAGTVAELIHSHFDAHQRDGSPSSSAAARAAKELRGDILSSSAWTAEVSAEAAGAAVRCLDCAISAIANASKTTKKEQWGESVTATIELAAAFASCVSKDDNGASMQALIARAAEYCAGEKDAIRTEGCHLLGLAVKFLLEGGRAAPSALRKKGDKKAKQAAAAGSTRGEGWKAECLLEAGRALLPRATDKIAKVRGAGIAAAAGLLSKEAARLFQGGEWEEHYEQLGNSLQASLLWILSNDSSAANRALAARTLPATEDNVPSIIERIKDVDGKVREAAIDSLRENVELEALDVEGRVEVLRNGLTKR